tara:strand:+ start:313 stop:762 length:450 start_codon:yes stop_codon:yes gene_type:complete
MIEVGGLTVINFKTYTCLEIDDEGYAHLKDITTTQGRPKKMKAKQVPYFVEGNFITPEPEPVEKYVIKTKISIRNIAKDEVEMPISNSAVRLLSEWADTAIRNIVINAQRNAMLKGSNTINAGHIFWLETNKQVEGYWPEQNDYVKKGE